MSIELLSAFLLFVGLLNILGLLRQETRLNPNSHANQSALDVFLLVIGVLLM